MCVKKTGRIRIEISTNDLCVGKLFSEISGVKQSARFWNEEGEIGR